MLVHHTIDLNPSSITAKATISLRGAYSPIAMSVIPLSFHCNDYLFRSFSGVAMVTLLVGEEETPFNIHMDLLCKASPFFNSAFMGAGNFKETSTKSMKLPEDDAATMDRMIQWIYFGCYPVDSEIEPKSPEQLQDLSNASLMQLATLYVAADKYGIFELKNHVIDRFYDLLQGNLGVKRDQSLIGYIYENTTAGSTLRKLLVEWRVWRSPRYFETCWTEEDVRNHPSFAADVLGQFAARVRGVSNPFNSDGRYRYHEKLEDKASVIIESSSGSGSDSESEEEE